MRYEIVNPADWIDSVRELLNENWAETGFDFPFDPDIRLYERLHATGNCFAVAAFDGGSVVGYCSVAIGPHAHNPSVIVAANDALFVSPPYRLGITPGRLMLLAEHEARRRGASRFSWHCREGTPLESVLVRHGYQPVDRVVMKGL